MITDIKNVINVDIIVMQDSSEAYALRAVLESFNIQTRTHFIGNVNHFIALFEQPDYLHPVVILSCHGSKKGLLIPKLAPHLEEKMPYHSVLNSAHLDEFLNLKGQIIINIGCCLGQKKHADAFLNHKAHAYIGAPDYIESHRVLIFSIHFLYAYLVLHLSFETAFDQATSHLPDKNDIQAWKQ